MRRHLEAGQAFDMGLTHDIIDHRARTLGATHNLFAFKLTDVSHPVEHKKYFWGIHVGSSWSQEIELTANDAKTVEHVTLHTSSFFGLKDIIGEVKEIADKESAARELEKSPDKNLWMFRLSIDALRGNANELRDKLLKKKIVLPP